MPEITLPKNFKPRDYQSELLQDQHRFTVAVWHRRGGKTKTVFNRQIARTQLKYSKSLEKWLSPNDSRLTEEERNSINSFYTFLPTYRQAKSVMFDELVKEHIPMELVEKINESELAIYYKNGSIQRFAGCDDINKHRGINPIDVVFDEFSEENPEIWTAVVQPILRENHGTATFIFTPKGHNASWEIYEYAKQNPEQWFVSLKTVDDTRGLSEKEIEEARRATPEALFQQEYYCFPSGTEIITNNGVVNIENICVGDYVYTHTNRYRKVLKTMAREYSGELIRIKTYGNNKDLICTPNHPIRICNDGINYKWVRADELTIKDRINFGKPLLKKEKIVSEEMSKIIAWFIAEGNYSKQTVAFSLNKNEIEYQKEITDCLNKIITSKVCKINNNTCCQIYTHNCNLGEFLIKQCGSGAINKKIPFDLISGYEKKVYDILINGDGHTLSKNKDVYTTISKTLAYQVQLLANSLGYTAGISLRKINGPSIIEGRDVDCNDSYVVRINKDPKTKNRKGSGRAGGLKMKKHKYSVSATILNISKENHNGLVYNFEVQDANSYTANGRIVHNCSFLEDAGAFFRGIKECLYEADDNVNPKHFYNLGVDLAKYNDWTVLTPFDLYSFKAKKQERFNQVDWNFQKMLVEAKARKYNNAQLKIDRTGVGDPVVEDLVRVGLNIGDDGAIVFTSKTRREMLDNLAILLQQKKIKIPNDPDLVAELEAFQYSLNSKGKIEVKSRKGLHDDRVMSLALAVYGVDSPIMNEAGDFYDDEETTKKFDRFAII